MMMMICISHMMMIYIFNQTIEIIEINILSKNILIQKIIYIKKSNLRNILI